MERKASPATFELTFLFMLMGWSLTTQECFGKWGRGISFKTRVAMWL